MRTPARPRRTRRASRRSAARAGGSSGRRTSASCAGSPTASTSTLGTPVNPLAPARVPGGSSSGSAVVVALGEADVALGTDTGGSVRIPAACCGIAGLKTTRGRVSTAGVFPLAPPLDTVGPLARDVAGPGDGACGCSSRASRRRAVDRRPMVARLRVGADVGIDPAVERRRRRGAGRRRLGGPRATAVARWLALVAAAGPDPRRRGRSRAGLPARPARSCSGTARAQAIEACLRRDAARTSAATARAELAGLERDLRCRARQRGRAGAADHGRAATAARGAATSSG